MKGAVILIVLCFFFVIKKLEEYNPLKISLKKSLSGKEINKIFLKKPLIDLKGVVLQRC